MLASVVSLGSDEGRLGVLMDQRHKLELRAVIITGNAQYEKPLHNGYMRRPIWKICTETMKQLESEQYLTQKGFRKVE